MFFVLPCDGYECACAQHIICPSQERSSSSVMMEDMQINRRTDVIRTAERAIGLRKQWAGQACTLGQDVTTPAWLLQSNWELFGDARELVDATTRNLLMAKALDGFIREDRNTPLRATPGTIRLLSDGVARYAGTEAFDTYMARFSSASKEALGLSAGQCAALNVIVRYFRSLDEERMIEPGAAARILAVSSDAAGETIHVAEPLFAAPAMESWLRSLDPDPIPLASPICLADNVTADFRFASGATPLTRLVKEAAEEIVNQTGAQSDGSVPRIIVFAPEPHELFDDLAPVFAAEGIQGACICQVPFANTNVGIAIQAVRSLMTGEADALTAITDFAFQALSGISLEEAQALNTLIRADALMTREDAVDHLRQASPSFAAFEHVVAEKTEEAVCDLETMLSACETVMTLSQEDQAALTLLSTFARAAQTFDAPDPFALLEDAKVGVSLMAQGVEDARTRVEFRGMEAFDALPPASVEAVLFVDLTKEAMGLAKARPATESLFELMGIHDERDQYQEKRAAFAHALAAARNRMTCIMPLRNVSGKQLYPSFLYDELVEALAMARTNGAKRAVDADEIFFMPAFPDTGCVLTDETDLVSGFGRTFAPAQGKELYPLPERGRLFTLDMQSFMRRSVSYPTLPLLSASQIECYAHCPYRWFVERKVGIASLDEVLDNLSMGTFVHEVFRRTFDELAGVGITCINSQNVDEAQAVALRQFDQLLQAQSEADPGARCAVVHAQDELAMEELREGVANAFAFMASLPEGFSVFGSEVKIKDEDGIVYADAVLHGSVDRVDVDPDHGTFAILDYKGSVGEHEAGAPATGITELPGFIQALVYAQAIGRLPAFSQMTCAGALYLSYRAQSADAFAAGSFDRLRYPAQAVTDAAKCQVEMDFQAFLDAVEHALVSCVEGMLAGAIAPDPDAGSCAFCPLTFCPEREA